MKKLISKALVIAIAIVVATSMIGTSEVSAASKKVAKPAKVTCLKASIKGNDAGLSWKKAKHAKKYQIYRSTSKKGSYKKIKTTKSRTYVDKGLAYGRTYYYKVRGINGKKHGKFSSIKSVTIKAKDNDPPKQEYSTIPVVTAKAIDNTTIKVEWTLVYNADNYLVKITRGKYPVSSIKVSKGNSYTFTELNKNDIYEFVVYAYLGDTHIGECPGYSETVSLYDITYPMWRAERIVEYESQGFSKYEIIAAMYSWIWQNTVYPEDGGCSESCVYLWEIHPKYGAHVANCVTGARAIVDIAHDLGIEAHYWHEADGTINDNPVEPGGHVEAYVYFDEPGQYGTLNITEAGWKRLAVQGR